MFVVNSTFVPSLIVAKYCSEIVTYALRTSIFSKATIDGLLRGLIRDGYPVTEGFKIADIDPRKEEYQNCFTISDKARCIAGGVVEAIFSLVNR